MDTSGLPLFGFGFTHLPMLGWLAAAGVPIVIHFLSRRRYRETTWAAMQYLLAALQRQRRRLLVEQWLLLAVRTAAIVLVVLAAAGPYFQGSRFVAAIGQHTHHVLVLDGSYSMAYRPGERTRFEQAQELAARIVEESPPGDAFSLVLLATPPRTVIREPALDRAEVLREIEGLRIAHTPADVAAGLAAAQKVVREAQAGPRRMDRQEVLVVSDLGRVGWAPDPRSPEARQLRQQAARLAALATLTVIDLGQPGCENLAITRLQPIESWITPAVTAHFDAQIKAFGTRSAAQARVEWLVDGRSVEQRSVEVPAGGTARTSWAGRFPTPGDHTLEVRLEGDRLEVDNRRFLVVPVRPFVRVLCINGHPSGEPFGGASDYLMAALAPSEGPADDAPIRAEVALESALTERDLSGYDAVILCDVAQFTPREAKVLDAYLSGGGSAVFFLGAHVQVERYNQELAGGRGTPRVLPARLGAVAPRAVYRIDPRGYRHPAIQAFRGRERAGLLTTPVARYVKLDIAPDAKTQIVLGLTNGDPLIVEESRPQGRVVVVATSPDVAWTAMPLWPSFVPVVQELLAWCVRSEAQSQNVEVGQSITGTNAGGPVRLQRPDGATEALRAAGDGERWEYADTDPSGIYTARWSAPAARSEPFAVNVDTQESDLASVGHQELRSDVLPGVEFAYRTSWQAGDRTAESSAGTHNALSVGLLLGALALVFLETFLAWRAGHHPS